jgi:hypothetical protein
MPAMLLDIVAGIIASAPDLTVVDTVPGSMDLQSIVRRADVDVLVTQETSRAEEADHVALLVAERRLKIVALTDNGQHGVLYELRPHRVPLGDMSADRLVAAIRAAAGAETA